MAVRIRKHLRLNCNGLDFLFLTKLSICRGQPSKFAILAKKPAIFRYLIQPSSYFSPRHAKSKNGDFFFITLVLFSFKASTWTVTWRFSVPSAASATPLSRAERTQKWWPWRRSSRSGHPFSTNRRRCQATQWIWLKCTLRYVHSKLSNLLELLRFLVLHIDLSSNYHFKGNTSIAKS